MWQAKEKEIDDAFVVFKGDFFSGGDHEVIEKGVFGKSGKAAQEVWGRMAEDVSRQARNFPGERGKLMLSQLHARRPQVEQSLLKRLAGKIPKKPKIG